jgi:hypothetical protein
LRAGRAAKREDNRGREQYFFPDQPAHRTVPKAKPPVVSRTGGSLKI